jgi:hypothetical protein
MSETFQRMHDNPFDNKREPKRFDVAELILSGDTVSWNDIQEEVGNFSPRTMGYILRGLEDQGATVLRLRDAEHGTLYRYDPTCEYDERYRLSKPNGPDAKRQRGEDGEEETEEG